jgi:hypothetical protein
LSFPPFLRPCGEVAIDFWSMEAVFPHALFPCHKIRQEIFASDRIINNAKMSIMIWLEPVPQLGRPTGTNEKHCMYMVWQGGRSTLLDFSSYIFSTGFQQLHLYTLLDSSSYISTLYWIPVDTSLYWIPVATSLLCWIPAATFSLLDYSSYISTLYWIPVALICWVCHLHTFAPRSLIIDLEGPVDHTGKNFKHKANGFLFWARF